VRGKTTGGPETMLARRRGIVFCWVGAKGLLPIFQKTAL
jgi:hypothetical protein